MDAELESPIRLSEADLRTALDLVSQAAIAIPRLQKRSDELEHAARSVLDRAKATVAAVAEEIEALRRRSNQEQARADEAERRLADAERRAAEAGKVATHALMQMARFREEVVQKLLPACEALEDHEKFESIIRRSGPLALSGNNSGDAIP
jgi:methyl-accepting chemotaxis protein